MRFLELKVPPPLVALTIGCVMWILAKFGPQVPLPTAVRILVGLVTAAVGLSISITGGVSLCRAKTTINPFKPETATALVPTGIYAVTRNPMYLGLLVVLVSWLLYLASPVALIGPLAFWLYINRFQIIPEEQALVALFGNGFREYTARVRRWL